MIECVLCPNDHRVVERTLLVSVRTGPPAVCAVVWYAGLVVHDTNGKDSISLEAIVALDVRSNASHENKQRFHSPDRFPDCLKELLSTPVDCFAEGRLADHLLLVEGLQSWAQNHLTPAGNGPRKAKDELNPIAGGICGFPMPDNGDGSRCVTRNVNGVSKRVS